MVSEIISFIYCSELLSLRLNTFRLVCMFCYISFPHVDDVGLYGKTE